MKVLMVGGDPNILRPGSDARKRIENYARILGELHMVVVSKKSGETERSDALFLYAAGARFPIFRMVLAYRTMRRLAKKVGFNVLSVQAPDEIGFLAFLVSREFSIPLQFQIHTDIMSPWYRRASWREWARFKIAKFLIPRADCVRAVSERIKKSIIRNIKHKMKDSKISVLPIFTDISKFLEAEPDSRVRDEFRNYNFKMVAAGRFVDKEKNFSMLIEIMPEFLKLCPGALLVLAGDGPDLENYKLQITNYKLEKNVIIEGWRDDLSAFLKCFDVFLMPSNYEGWGRAVIEAMAAGLPVVMTDVGLAREVVERGRNGVVVPVGKQEEFLRACIDLYLDSAKRMRLAEGGVKTVLQLKPSTQQEYQEYYKESFTSCIS
jgi:glycosyltransferase involved in cell wall biosynthesis